MITDEPSLKAGSIAKSALNDHRLLVIINGQYEYDLWLRIP
jgi:hypothetical protein